MRVKLILVSVISLLFMVFFTYSLDAQPIYTEKVKIKINGAVRSFDPSAHIYADRAMVPIRFVVEDEALKGQVYWDNILQKVAIDCQGKYIEFYIGSKKATVEGKIYNMDVAPYVYNDRTFIPLRFLVENLGAIVSWNSQADEVNINFDKPTRVFAYYYQSSLAEYKDNLSLFTDIAFRWFQTDSYGDLTYEYQDDYNNLLKLARQKGIATHASVVLMDTDALHTLLGSSTNRSRLIRNLINEVYKNGYDGVNIDFEFIDAKDKAYFTILLTDLKDALGADKQLSVAVMARTSSDNWATPYEYDKIGQIVDSVEVMSYDYSYKTSAPGPVAPLWWVKNVVDYMTAKIPAQKILLGMATYGYDWPSGGTGTTITEPKLTNIVQRYKVTSHFDNQSMSPYFIYYDNNGKYHQIWMENEASLSEKINVIHDNHLGGISFWRIGNGFTDLYNLLDRLQ